MYLLAPRRSAPILALCLERCAFKRCTPTCRQGCLLHLSMPAWHTADIFFSIGCSNLTASGSSLLHPQCDSSWHRQDGHAFICPVSAERASSINPRAGAKPVDTPAALAPITITTVPQAPKACSSPASSTLQWAVPQHRCPHSVLAAPSVPAASVRMRPGAVQPVDHPPAVRLPGIPNHRMQRRQ